MNEKLARLTETLSPVGLTGPERRSRLPAAALTFDSSGDDGRFELRDYWRILHGKRLTVLAAVIAALVAAGTYNTIRTPTYRAAATVQIDREQPNIARLSESSFPQFPEQPDYLETQYKVLKSRTLARRVIARLGLAEDGELVRDIDPEEAAADTGQPHPRVLEGFLKRLGVGPSKGTRLVEVSYESTDRDLAPKVANALAETFVEHNLETKWNATQKASAWLEQQLAQLEAKLQDSEAKLREYAAAHSILFVEERKDITTEKLAKLEDELTRAESDRVHKQSLAMLVEDAVRRGADLPGGLSSASYESFIEQLAALRREYSRQLVTFAPGYPAVRRTRQEMEQVEAAIDEEKQRILAGVSDGLQLALSREALLREAAIGQRRKVNLLSDDFIEYNVLKRDAETNRQLYQGLLQRLKEAGVSAGLRASNIAVLDPAETPLEPYRPRKAVNYGLGLAAGLMLGVALAFVQEHLHTGLRTPEEVERLTGLNLLAVIPRSRGRHERKVNTESIEGHEDVSRRSWEPEQALSEAYRTLRSSVLLGWDESMRRILLTSSQPQEGKTTLSLNLACSLAQLGRSVLVIDADMRRPDCGRQLGVDAEAGLSEFLRGEGEIDDIVKSTSVEGLSLITAGRSSSTASDLLYSPRLAPMLQEVGERFDHVVIDSPPSLVLSDARTISRMVEGVVMVVSDKTERGSLLRAKQMFDDAGVPFLGFVMNRVNLNRLDYGYYREYGYNYSYADDKNAKDEKRARLVA